MFPRVRAFCLTINNYTDDDIASAMAACEESEHIHYFIVGFEGKGDDETPHMQCYVYFSYPKDTRQVSKIFNRAHIIKCVGTAQQNIDYCNGDGDTAKKHGKEHNEDVWEYGERSCQGRASWDKIVESQKNPKDNIHLFQQYHRTYVSIMRKEPKSESRFAIVCPNVLKFDIADYFKMNGVHFCNAIGFGERHTESYEDEYCSITEFNYSPPPELCTVGFDIESWFRGYPHKIKRGYELIPYDPQVVIILHDGKHKEALYLFMFGLMENDFNIFDVKNLIDIENIEDLKKVENWPEGTVTEFDTIS